MYKLFMFRVFRLVLILMLTFGAVTAPDVSSASMSATAMAQMEPTESADGLCNGCDPAGFADGTACEGGCPVPCGSSGTAGLLAKMPSERLAMPFGTAIRGAEPLIPVGANPSLDPFPPKLPV
ncbi:hypothetical protein [Thioclava sp. SK-1]|uniref:hypothetical protein n=1 Tax=Thioclava sp. SK-1 TaxID=1889770 RepID=UPI002100B7DD|nr:hypothetical protein [Thioclava sp. SK-1]